MLQACAIWDNWGTWGACTQTCGLGIRTRSRICLNGRRGEDGCTGDDTDVTSCANQVKKQRYL